MRRVVVMVTMMEGKMTSMQTVMEMLPVRMKKEIIKEEIEKEMIKMVEMEVVQKKRSQPQQPLKVVDVEAETTLMIRIIWLAGKL